MENSIDGDTDCSEKCPTDRCLLLEKRDKQTTSTATTATINLPDEDEGDDEDEDDDDDNEYENIVSKNANNYNHQHQFRPVNINANTNGKFVLPAKNGNDNNLTVSRDDQIFSSNHNLENNQHQQDNKQQQTNSLDQMKPCESHNHSENNLSDLVAKSKRFPRLDEEKKKSDHYEVNKDAINSHGDNLNGSSSMVTSSLFETTFHPNGNIVTSNNNDLVNNSVHLHIPLNINNNNKINPGNHFYCPNNNNLHNSGACNGKNLSSSKCIRRVISSDSGGSNKSSSNKSGRKSRSGGPPQSPPDGGWGWVVVFASFMISLIADGVSLSYGFFQMDLSEHFGQSKGKTALVGSLLLSMPALTGPIASALTDRYGCRSMTIVSGLLSASGFILGSFARNLEHLFIAFSITGIGLSLSYVTSIVIVAYYFNTKRSFATGLAVCGTGIGTFLFAPLTTYLLKEYSWRGTLLIMSGFFLNIIVFGALMRDINVSEVDSIDDQESDSDEDSVIEPVVRGNCNNGSFHCCSHQQNNLKGCTGCCGANLIFNGSQCSTIDVNNRNSFPLSPQLITTPNAETFNYCDKLSHHLDSLTINGNKKPTNDSSSIKPLSSIYINSHCSSSILPNDEQLTNCEPHCKVNKLFHEPDHQPYYLNQCNHHQVYANHHHHHHQCNHQIPTNGNRRFQRFQSSYSSSKPKSDLRNYSSLVNIPTYITTDSLVSKDVLDEISGRKDGNLNQLLQKYPNLLSNLTNHDQERSLFLSSGVIGQNDCTSKDKVQVEGQRFSMSKPLSIHETTTTSFIDKHNYNDLSTTNCHNNNSNKVNDLIESRPRRLRGGGGGCGGDPESGLNLPRNTVTGVNRLKITTGNNLIGPGNNNISGVTGKDSFGSKLQRASLTYRTAVFRDVRRYRLRSSSAPDIFTNSMVTIAERETFLQDIKQVIVDSVDLSIFKNIRFTIFCISNLLLHGCIDVPYVYLPDHAISSGICVKEMAFYLISVLGIANTLGTIIVGYIGDKPWLRPSTWYSGLTALGGISMALIPMARNYYLLAVLAAFYGFSVSANYTLVSVILVEIISLDKFTNAYGLMLLVQGIASMLGPPIAGWLFDISGDYNTTFYVIGLCVLASGIIVFPLNESLSLASFSSSVTSSSSSSKGSSITESPSRTSSPVEDKITVLSSNKTLFDKEPSP